MEDGAPRPCLVVVRADNEPITLKELADGVLALAVAGRHAAPNGAGPRRGSGQHRACPSRCPVVSGRVHASDLVRPTAEQGLWSPRWLSRTSRALLTLLQCALGIPWSAYCLHGECNHAIMPRKRARRMPVSRTSSKRSRRQSCAFDARRLSRSTRSLLRRQMTALHRHPAKALAERTMAAFRADCVQARGRPTKVYSGFRSTAGFALIVRLCIGMSVTSGDRK